MTQFKFYQYATWGLLVLNIGLVAFFFLTKPEPSPRNGGKLFQRKAMDILHLDKEQRDLFIESAKTHNVKMGAINTQQGQLLAPFFQQLSKPSGAVDSTTMLQVQALETEKITVTYQHFAEVKALLRQDQEAYFEKFMEKALQILLLNKSRGK